MLNNETYTSKLLELEEEEERKIILCFFNFLDKIFFKLLKLSKRWSVLDLYWTTQLLEE